MSMTHDVPMCGFTLISCSCIYYLNKSLYFVGQKYEIMDNETDG